MSTSEKHLYRLEELSDYKIASGYPDVRGWEVRDFNNRVIGKVSGLLANVEREKVVYLDVEVDDTIIEAGHDPYGRPANKEVHEFINEKGENHVIIPIGLADLNEEKEYVSTSTIDHRTFAETKRFRRETPIAREYEVIILDSYGRRQRRDWEAEDVEDVEDMEQSEAYLEDRMENIKARHREGEHRTGEEIHSGREAETVSDPESEDNYRRNRWLDDEDFYNRSEFDDTRFRRRKR